MIEAPGVRILRITRIALKVTASEVRDLPQVSIRNKHFCILDHRCPTIVEADKTNDARFCYGGTDRGSLLRGFSDGLLAVNMLARCRRRGNNFQMTVVRGSYADCRDLR